MQMEQSDIETKWLELCSEYALLYPDRQWQPGLYIEDGDVNPAHRERLMGIIDGFGWIINGDQHHGEVMSRSMINIYREWHAREREDA